MENKLSSQHKSVQEDIIDLRATLLKYLKKWHWFVISIFVCFVIAFAYLKLTPPKYSVQTTILLRNDNANPLSQLSMLEDLGGSSVSKEVEDEIQILTSNTIISQVTKSLNLGTEYFAKSRSLRYKELYPVSPIRLVIPETFNDTLNAVLVFDVKNTKKGYEVTLNVLQRFKEKYLLKNISDAFATPYGEMKFTEIAPLKKNTKYKIISYPNRILTEKYSATIAVAPVNKKSNAIQASTVSETPGKAKDILNKLIHLYNQDAVNDKNLISQNAYEFVNKQIVNVEQELSHIEVEIEKYKKANNITDISSEAKLFLESIGEYDKQLSEIQTQINLVAYIDEYVKQENNQYGLIPANLGISDVSLIALIKEYNDALLERLKLLRTTNEQNPVISQMENMLSVIRSSIITSIKSISDGLIIAKEDLTGKGSQFTSKIQDVPRQEREYIEMMRRQEVSQTLYIFLLQKKKENELNMATTLPSAKLLDEAYSSLAPVSPKRTITLFLALFIGACVPLIVIYISDLLNNKIQSKKEYQRLVHPPFIGSICLNTSGENIVVAEGKINPITEMFRQLRTNLHFMIAGKKNPVLLVTSSVSGEGKSFISVNLAISLTMMKKKVVLLGLDIRNPMLAKYLKIPKDNKGISLFLSDTGIKLKDIIFDSKEIPNLSVIQGGTIPPNPTELLMSPRLDEMISELKESFDYIIIDSAPVGVVSDTFQVNRLVDNTIYISRQDYTTRELTTLINEIYDERKLNNMAVVLNGTDEISTYYRYNHKKYLREK